ncbi:MAG: helix-turn-helix domain-containing protein [Candidatus Thiodiazotropha taylori]|nr:helix-turn-helix domain-containing protein [Candidatus Thiodiazotropha taylori]
MVRQDLEQLTEAIISGVVTTLRMTNSPVPPEKDLWGPDEVANYLKVNRRTVAERYAARPDFPKVAKRLPGERGQLRWRAKDIMKWANNH